MSAWRAGVGAVGSSRVGVVGAIGAAGAFASAGIPIVVAVGDGGTTGVPPVVGFLSGGMPIVVAAGDGVPTGGVLAFFGRAPGPIGGIEGTTNFGAMPLAGSSPTRVDRSPIATHSASALTASTRPAGAGGLGRGSAGIPAGRGATLGGPGFTARRARSSSVSSVLLGSSGSMNLSVIPTRP